ncbi:hypothetical protein BN2475_710009 [Paraburkholderia ribeironis]|uniref:Uncharacterized protein n=1 Tax=Paraburkholderia ribeironis TaxID=1247936 RepID=A0A1N7SI09_9BURK|nr:hypothetical protein [Paraburkholderia ribeironis]SIT47023.1 hypothetical protein BN2475_710009 [Paraburkholderia ribeironis]
MNPPVYRASTIVFRNMEDMEARAKAMSTPEGQDATMGVITANKGAWSTVIKDLEKAFRFLHA